MNGLLFLGIPFQSDWYHLAISMLWKPSLGWWLSKISIILFVEIIIVRMHWGVSSPVFRFLLKIRYWGCRILFSRLPIAISVGVGSALVWGGWFFLDSGCCYGLWVNALLMLHWNWGGSNWKCYAGKLSIEFNLTIIPLIGVSFLVIAILLFHFIWFLFIFAVCGTWNGRKANLI